ncbi:MAG: hypothetical protein CBC13_10370 [Planctomycetia bacterium TMED53]|nr:MAG: hypothetical protein CBC13_10370 [Planctomycetia bacterium TMED53]
MKFSPIVVFLFLVCLTCSEVNAQIATIEAVGGDGYIDTTVTAQILGTTDLATHGFSLGLSHDPTILAIDALTDVRPGAVVSAVNGDSGPDFFEINIAPAGGTGLTIACITDLFSPFDFLPPMDSSPLIEIDYRILPTAVVGSSSPLEFTSALGSPAVQTVLVMELAEVTPAMISGLILVTEPHFIRGDLNHNGSVTLLDGVLLLYRVSGLEAPGSCSDADDINDDGVLTLGDAVYLFQYMFTGGAPIPGSDGSCGPDQTGDDDLDCMEFGFCG